MDKQQQSRAPLIIAIVLLLLPALYVGSYLAMVRPGGISVGEIKHNGQMTPYFPFNKNYPFFEEQADWFFWPLEQIDRKMRPGSWVDPLRPFDGLSNPGK